MESLPDGTAVGLFVPLEPPPEGSDAAERLSSGAKLLEIPPALTHITFYPLNTRTWQEDFLAPKYSQIRTIDVPVDLVEDWDIEDVLENLPSGFTKDIEYGLGLARECDPFISFLEENTDCTKIDFTPSGTPKVNGSAFEISLDLFDPIRAEFSRIKARGDYGIRRVRDNFVHNTLGPHLGLARQQLSLGRLESSKWITRVASGEQPLSDVEQGLLVSATIANAAQIAREAPARSAQLQREIDLVNLDQLIAHYADALSAKHKEDWWQDFFERNVFALQLLFGGPTIFVDSQVPIGEGDNSLKGKKIADYLMKNAMTNNASLVEIKRPSTKLLKKRPYRAGVYGVVSEISEAVTQVLDQALQLTRHEGPTQDRTGDSSWRSDAPRCFVVAGRLSELDDEDKKKSFELYREHLSGVRIVAYDEIYEALITLRNFMKAPDGDTTGS